MNKGGLCKHIGLQINKPEHLFRKPYRDMLDYKILSSPMGYRTAVGRCTKPHKRKTTSWLLKFPVQRVKRKLVSTLACAGMCIYAPLTLSKPRVFNYRIVANNSSLLELA